MGGGYATGTTTTSLTSTNDGQQPQNLRLQLGPGPLVHHPLQFVAQPYALYPVPFLAAAPAPTVEAKTQSGEENKKTEAATPQQKSPEPTTTPSPFTFRPQRARANEKLVQAPRQSHGRALPLRSSQNQLPKGLLPPKVGKSRVPQVVPPSVAYKLVKVQETPKYKYIIDKIQQIPGELLAKIVAKERLIKSHFAPRPDQINVYHRYAVPVHHAHPPKYVQRPPSNMYLPAAMEPQRESTTAAPSTTTTTTDTPVMVEATNDLDLNFQLPNGENVILLQPRARAVSGKDGTSIANPISRVILKRNRPQPTTILYRPQAVAISGPGGTSHAQAELIIDYVDE